MAAQPQGHWLPRNDQTWTPPAVIFLDSETFTESAGPVEVERLRCWCARIDWRRDRRRAGERHRARGVDAAGCAAAVDAWASYGRSTWLYAHNLAFDLSTTQLAEGLAALGWELGSRHSVSGGTPWLVMRKGRRDRTRPGRGRRAGEREQSVYWDHTLTITDSFSLLPVPLPTLAEYTAADKPPLPAADAPDDQWWARCEADVDVLAQAVLTVMDWWEANDCGMWQITGPGSGWSAYRHTIRRGDVLITTDDQVIEDEHAACYGGRRDVFRVGNLPPGRYAEVDFTCAYPTVAATQQLPRKLMGPLTPLIARSILAGRCRYGMLAECVIETDRPRWPVRACGRVLYPVGIFRTTLAGPDIQAAHELGCLRSVGRGWFYSLSDHMRPWAEWVLGLVGGAGRDVPGPVGIAAKNWSRAVIGKTAQRGWRTIPYAGPPADGWSFEDTIDLYSGVIGSITGLSGKWWLSFADQPGSHEFPAILAWIEAHVRQRLCDVVEAAPAGSVIQCDTDGMMVSYAAVEAGLAGGKSPGGDKRHGRPAVDQAIGWWSELAAPLVMREKTHYRQVRVQGPQHVVLDGKPRMAGMPRSAWAAGDGKWAARLWPGLSWQIRNGDGAGYARPVQEYLTVGVYAAGWVLADGAVRPPEAALTESGDTTVLAWPATRWARDGDQLAAHQPPWTEGIPA